MNKEEFNDVKKAIFKMLKENKILKENSYHNDKVVDKVNWENMLLKKENKQLKDNWNKLKKWLEKELGDRINPNKDKWLTGVYDAYRETIDKMQELEKGDSNETIH